jgi:UDP-N-acetyl-D-glucosamine dehydrogenase
LISLESTTYPGTTDEILLDLFKESGLEAGRDYFLVFSPEREDPGNARFSTGTIPKVVGGTTSSCLELGVTLYQQIIDKVIPVSSTRAAELVKLLENIYRAVNIALVNELKLLTDRMDIDIWEVIESASSKPFGFTPFYPGPGLGGHCIPIDPFYLSWKAKKFDFSTRYIQLAGEINTSMPHDVIEKIGAALNDRGRSIRESGFWFWAWRIKRMWTTSGNPHRSKSWSCSTSGERKFPIATRLSRNLHKCVSTISRICLRSRSRKTRCAARTLL